MRIVYDDTMQEHLVEQVDRFMRRLDVQSVLEYGYGMNRIQMHKVKTQLNKFLSSCYLEIGNTVTHAYGIGNNCQYPVYYYAENEIQHCANIDLNSGMFGEGYLYITDYNDNEISDLYEIHEWGIKRK